jgi:hypothetical protein
VRLNGIVEIHDDSILVLTRLAGMTGKLVGLSG